MSAPTGAMQSPGNISGYKQRSMSNFTPEMMNLFQMLLGGAGQGLGGKGGGLEWLSKLASGDQSMFSQLEAPAMRQFQGQLGQIGSQFGDIGAMGSSAFQNATSGAAADFSEKLQSQRVGLQQGAIERLLGLSQNLMQQRPYENFLEPKSDWKGMLGKILGGAAGAFGGPFAGAVGGGLGEKALPAILKLFGLG